MKNQYIIAIIQATALCFAVNAWGGELLIPNAFTAGTTAVAAEVNDNFSAVKTEVDDNNARINVNTTKSTANADSITAMQATITAMQSTIAALQKSVDALSTQLTTVQDNSVLGLNTYLKFETDAYGRPTALFNGVNVQVVNGGGTTDTVNGLGNVIIGYDTVTESSQEICSDGYYQNSVSCKLALEIWGTVHKTGSHYLVVGDQNNYSQFGGIVVGLQNSSNQQYASVVSGSGNVVSGRWSASIGGRYNLTTGDAATVNGGEYNQASGPSSSVSGGGGNTASGTYASVSGGGSNSALATGSTVSGGDSRSATGTYDWVAGSLFEDF